MHDDYTQVTPDPGGDTDPATDIEEAETTTAGGKHKAKRPATSARKYVPGQSHFAFILTGCCQVEAVMSNRPI